MNSPENESCEQGQAFNVWWELKDRVRELQDFQALHVEEVRREKERRLLFGLGDVEIQLLDPFLDAFSYPFRQVKLVGIGIEVEPEALDLVTPMGFENMVQYCLQLVVVVLFGMLFLEMDPARETPGVSESSGHEAGFDGGFYGKEGEDVLNKVVCQLDRTAVRRASTGAGSNDRTEERP